MNYQLIEDGHGLLKALAQLEPQRSLAVDMEMENNLHHYGLHLALIQIATPANFTFIFDPTSIRDMAPLGALLTDSRHEMIVHNADFDRRTCHQLYGWILGKTFDTQIAAMLCGFKKFGLASLLQELFGVQTEKRFQRHDWLRRPISTPALEYAARDVNLLHALRDILTARLIELKRLEWAKEEFARAERNLTGEPQAPAFFRIKHSAGLSPRKLAVLKAIFEFRDSLARQLDMPAQFVIRDSILTELARNPPREAKALKAIRGLHPALYRKDGAEGFIAAAQSGLDMPEQTHPAWHVRRHFPQPEAGWDSRLKEMRAWRTEIALELNLEPHIVLEAGVLEWCARHPNTTMPSNIAGGIRKWQRIHILPDLKKRFALP